VQGIQLFEKYKIKLAEAKADGDEERVAELEKLLEDIDLKKISTDSGRMVGTFSEDLGAI
jgi:hypothetical protein